MAADRQEAGDEHYWYGIRAFGPFGQSRLVTYGCCATRAQSLKNYVKNTTSPSQTP